MRVLLDANLLIAYLLTPHRDSPVVRAVLAAVQGRFTLLMPEELLAELVRTAEEKTYLAQRIAPHELTALVEILSRVAETIPRISRPIPPVTRDPKDDYLLAYAVVGQADYLVTGDHDLLSLHHVDNLKIVNPQAFCQALTT